MYIFGHLHGHGELNAHFLVRANTWFVKKFGIGWLIAGWVWLPTGWRRVGLLFGLAWLDWMGWMGGLANWLGCLLAG